MEKEHIKRCKKIAPVYSFIIYILAYIIDKPNQNLMIQ
ncbi:hypothetical protein SALWKB29_0269 [Snodgrassella communis]|uniref:Uncharacterized protein n=1 Tax=Snodgrassella communis TaxID=2946699 RepID=A0A836Z6H2_9NEIS|nr:hypothetical protein SALWKB29_0269 [Snodgrassella communis]